MKKTAFNFRMVLASAATALTFTALTAACDQQTTKVKTAQLAPADKAPAAKASAAKAPAAKKAPALIPAAPAHGKSVAEILSFLPDPVAIIGNRKISKADFLKKLGNIPPEFLAQMPRPVLEQQFRMAIETLVNEQVLLISAEKAGIKPSKELAVAEFNKKLKEIPADKLEILKKELAKQGGKTIEDLRKEFISNPEIINMTAINLWIEKNLKNKIKVSDADVVKFYKENASKFKTPRTITSSHILITNAAQPGQAMTPAQEKAAKAKAETLLAQIRKGADFGTIAAKESKCGSARNKGMLGEMAQNQLVPEYFNAAFALQPGQVSNVVKSPFGYHIIKLHAKKEAAVIPLDAKVKAELKEELKGREMEKQLKAYIEAQKKALKVVVPPFKAAPAKAAPAKAAPAKAAAKKAPAKANKGK